MGVQIIIQTLSVDALGHEKPLTWHTGGKKIAHFSCVNNIYYIEHLKRAKELNWKFFSGLFFKLEYIFPFS